MPEKRCENIDTMSSMMYTYSLQNKKYVMLYLLSMILLPVEHLGIPHCIGVLYERIRARKPIGMVMCICLALVVGFQVMHIMSDYVQVQMYPNIQKFFRTYMMRKVVDLISFNFKEIDIGNFLTKVVQLPLVAFSHVHEYIGTIIPSVITLIFTTFYLAIYGDVKMALIFAVLILCMFIVVRKTLTNCKGLASERTNNYYALYSGVDDTLRNIQTVMTFDKLQDELDRIDVYQTKYADLSSKVFFCGLKSKYICLPVLMTYSIVFLAVLFSRVQQGELPVGTFISIAIMIVLTLNSSLSLLGVVKDLITREGIIDASLKMFQTCVMPRIPYDLPPRVTRGLNLQDVTFSYDENKQVFDKFNLVIEKNKTTIIIGEIASGKTTLLSIIMKLQEPQGGEVFFDGGAYSGMSSTHIRSLIGFVPQNPILLDRSICENILFGVDGNKTRKDVDRVIDELNLGDFIRTFSNGLDTHVGKYGSKISGGQRQVIWIIKILLIDPEIVILDEPTSAMDESTKQIIGKLLLQIMNNKTVIMVTHDLDMLRLADRTVTMSRGRIIKDHSV